MNDQDTILQQGIADILVPAAPATIAFFSVSNILIIAAALVMIVLLWHWRYSKRAIALRMLKDNALESLQKGDFYATAYCIATVIRHRLGITRLDTKTPLPARLASQQQRWDEFLATLQSGRYSKDACPKENMLRLYAEAGFWLRRWP